MLRKVAAAASVVAATCAVLAVPATAVAGPPPGVSCGQQHDGDNLGARARCDKGRYFAIIICALQGPLTGPDKKFWGSAVTAGKWATVRCGTGYYFPPGRPVGVKWV